VPPGSSVEPPLLSLGFDTTAGLVIPTRGYLSRSRRIDQCTDELVAAVRVVARERRLNAG